MTMNEQETASSSPRSTLKAKRTIIKATTSSSTSGGGDRGSVVIVKSRKTGHVKTIETAKPSSTYNQNKSQQRPFTIDDKGPCDLEKKAIEEILTETQRGSSRAEVGGVLAWRPAPKVQKRLINSALLQALQSNKRHAATVATPHGERRPRTQPASSRLSKVSKRRRDDYRQ